MDDQSTESSDQEDEQEIEQPDELEDVEGVVEDVPEELAAVSGIIYACQIAIKEVSSVDNSEGAPKVPLPWTHFDRGSVLVLGRRLPSPSTNGGCLVVLLSKR